MSPASPVAQTREASFVLPSVVIEPLDADSLYPTSASSPAPPEGSNWLARRRIPYDHPCDSARTSITRVNLPLVEEEEGLNASMAPSIRNAAEDVVDDDDDDAHTQDDAHAHEDKAGSMSKLPTDEEGGAPPTPQVTLTFLTVTARRRTMSFDPETTVGAVKELVWNGWPEDWQEERPPAPVYLRILYLGKVLQDHDTLSKLKIPVHTPSPDVPPPQPTIVHLSVRAYAPAGEDQDLKKKRRGDSDEDDATRGCCSSCIIC